MNMILPEKVYPIAKWVCQLFLPATAALYFGLSKIWGFPLGEEIVGTIAVVNTFLGVVLGIGGAQYETAKLQQENNRLMNEQ